MMAIGRDGLGGRRKTRAGRSPRGRAGALMASILLSCALALPALPVHADATDALFEAAWRGTASEVKAALSAGANPGVRLEDGKTPLHWAAVGNTNPSVITALIESGADPGTRGDISTTPLHGAAMFDSNPSAITALIEGGVDPGARDKDGKLPFDYAQDNEALKGTDAYRLLNEARFE